jgi:hypothetical protein
VVRQQHPIGDEEPVSCGQVPMHMIRRGQIAGAIKRHIEAQNQFIAGLFGLVT